ncbi:MAG: tRNA (adenosine(37)-N6)-threonylcarbamoyltransferase complex dimerization subunit type 1 TsaB [Alphaproteobacteria bacterium]
MTDFENPTLILDSSGASGLVALVQDTQVIQRESTALFGQAGHLTAALVELLAEANIGMQQIHKVITGVGPGSFTGIRICMATAQGLVAGLPKTSEAKLFGVDAFDLQYASYKRLHTDVAAQAVLVLVESKRSELFAQSYDEQGDKHGHPFLLPKDQAPKVTESILTGDALAGLQGVLEERHHHICVSPQDYICAHEKNLQSDYEVALKPFYLRPPDLGPAKVLQPAKPTGL